MHPIRALFRATLLAINPADGERHPPELGVLDREIARVKNGRALLIPASEKTVGHATHFRAAFWTQGLADLLRNAPRPMQQGRDRGLERR